MAKIELDKYYTSDELAKYCIETTKKIIGQDNITEYLEPSAGNGAFLNHLPKDTLSYDIEPEDNRIIKQDFLALDLDYKEGRCIIGNPPYGRVMNLATAFYKKSIQLGDFISFILPISQLNNNFKLYEFDLIYSENLGRQLYSGKEVHCCLNIYKRNPNGLNKRKKYDLEDVEIQEWRKSNCKRQELVGKTDFDYDIAICAWGGNCGREIEYEGQYAQEFYIKVKNKSYKEKIVKLIKETEWDKVFPMTATPKLQKWRVYKYLKEMIPELK